MDHELWLDYTPRLITRLPGVFTRTEARAARNAHTNNERSTAAIILGNVIYPFKFIRQIVIRRVPDESTDQA